MPRFKVSPLRKEVSWSRGSLDLSRRSKRYVELELLLESKIVNFEA